MASAGKGTTTKRNTGTATRLGNGTKSSAGTRAASGSRSGGAKSARSTGTSAKRSATAAKNSRSSAQKNKTSNEIKNEVVLMITLVVAVLLLLSHFHLGGKVGEVINDIMFGLFGLVAYIFPILLFFGTAFFLANRGSRSLTGKMIYLFGMLFMLTALIQMMTTYSAEQMKAVDLYSRQVNTLKEGADLATGTAYAEDRVWKIDV